MFYIAHIAFPPLLPFFGSEQKRPGANRTPEFVPESPLQKGVFGSHLFSKELYRENAHSKSANSEGRHSGGPCSAGPFCLLPNFSFRHNSLLYKTTRNSHRESQRSDVATGNAGWPSQTQTQRCGALSISDI